MANNGQNPRYAFVLTCNNWTPDQLAHFKTYSEANCKFAVVGREIAPATGTRHLQAYMSRTTRQRLATVIAAFPGWHVAVARGSATQNRTYCSKEDPDPWVRNSARLRRPLRRHCVGGSLICFAADLVSLRCTDRSHKVLVRTLIVPESLLSWEACALLQRNADIRL